MLCRRGTFLAHFNLGFLGWRGPDDSEHQGSNFLNGASLGSCIVWSYQGPRRLEFGYIVQESTFRCLFKVGAPRFKGAKTTWNMKILAFPNGIEFGSCLFLELPRSKEAGIWLCCAEMEVALVK